MEKKLYTVLSIDGGGIRGVIPLRIIAEIERRLGRPISDAIDMAAGTSTGGIIAAGLSMRDPKRPDQPRFKAKDLESFYDKDGPEIFRKRPFNTVLSLFRPKYSSQPLKEALNRFFGETRLDQTLNSILLTAYDIERRESVFMRHLKNNPDGDNERRWRIRDAALSSSSAVTYFEPARVRSVSATPGGTKDDPKVREHTLVDPGLYVNNPTAAAFIAAQKEKPKDAELFVISLGTGSATRPFPYERAKRWGGIGWISPNNDVPVISVAMDGQTSLVDQNMELRLGDQYIRFDAHLRDTKDPKMSPNDAFDDASPENMVKIRHLADQIIADNGTKIDRVVEVLRARMLQKDLERATEPAPSSTELIEAARPRDTDSMFKKMASWWRDVTRATEKPTVKLGWNADELDRARHDHPPATTPVAPPERKLAACTSDPDHVANQTDVKATLEALVRRYGRIAGMSTKDIEADIADALAAAKEMTENGELIDPVKGNKPAGKGWRSRLGERVGVFFGQDGNTTPPDTKKVERLINGTAETANDSRVTPVADWDTATHGSDPDSPPGRPSARKPPHSAGPAAMTLASGRETTGVQRSAATGLPLVKADKPAITNPAPNAAARKPAPLPPP